jgi:RNA polymerase sigma-70 factor (sigma-E family)
VIRDDEVFTAFVHVHGTAFTRTAVLLTGSPHTAEDLVQSALAAAFVDWHALRDLDDAVVFVRRKLTMTNIQWRRRKASAEVPVPTARRGHREDIAGDLCEREDLLAALRKLSTRQRAVIVLRYFDDLTEAQTAEILGCSVGSVKTHGYRVLERLRELLGAPSLVVPKPGFFASRRWAGP